MKKGFTLIELLAVIVILAIIALIATPIILGIINDARKESNERSAELYTSAVRNAIASYQLTHPNAPTSFSELNIEHDGNVICTTQELYSDGSFYIADCTVNGDEVDYTYGEKQTAQVPKKQYYLFNLEEAGHIGGDLPGDAKENFSEINTYGHFCYFKLSVDNQNKVSEVYVCSDRFDTEVCLKGFDSDAYETNKTAIEQTYEEEEDPSGPGDSGDSIVYCTSSDVFCLSAKSNGIVSAADEMGDCSVAIDGSFICNDLVYSP